ncbi:MAG: branched-chain amino acid ABC transporter permease [Candidatus Bathyarchaeia archaeon]
MEFLPTIVGWLTYSALLSLMALGVTLLYRTTKVANFAHASFVTVAAYVTYTSTVILSRNPYLGVPIAFILVGLLGLLLFYAVLEPMRRRNSSTVMLMIATLAFDIIMLGVTNIHADYLNTVYKVPSRNVLLSGLDFKFMGEPGILFVALGTLALCSAAMYLLLNFTTLGIALRASMENPSLSEAIGINVSMMLAVSWFIAGGLAGVAGALIPLWTEINPGIGTLLLASIFCASIVGGLEQIYGAVLGGLLLGLVDVVGTSVLASVVGPWISFYEPIVPLVVLSVTMIVAPRGLAGLRFRRGK